MTHLIGFGAFLSLTLSLLGCGLAAIGNRWVIGLHTAPTLRRTERLKEWVGLPLAAYVLAIVCNMGTSLLGGVGLDGDVLQVFYATGLLMSGAGAIMIFGSVIAIRPVVRTPWRDVGSWEALHAEVEEQQALGWLPDRAWLVSARSAQHRLEVTHGQSQRLAARAGWPLQGLVKPGASCARWGFGVLKATQGMRIPTPWRSVVRWSVRDRWAQVTVTCAVVTAILAAVAPVAPRAPSYANAALVVAWLAVVILSVSLGARAFLIFNARLDVDWRVTARDVDAALGRWEREVRRSRRLPRRQPTR